MSEENLLQRREIRSDVKTHIPPSGQCVSILQSDTAVAHDIPQYRTLAGSLYATGGIVEGPNVGDCMGVAVGTKSSS